jgi:hypothetical protein
MPLPPPPPPARASAVAKQSVFGTPWPLPPERLRVRLKYVTARFLQMPEPRILLRSGTDILQWVQQMEDDGMPRQAVELVRLAIEEEPTQRALWLYLFGAAVRNRDASGFIELARLFSTLFPNDVVLEDIAYVGGVLPRDPAAAARIQAVATWSIAALTHRATAVQSTFHAALIAETDAVYRQLR